MKNPWEVVMDSALTRHDVCIRRLQERMKSVHRSHKDQGTSLGDIEQALEAERERSKKELRRIVSWKSDPVVYVRNYNRANLAVYHGSLHCGWANSRRVREMLLGEAEVAGLRPCISCGHLAVRSDTQDVAA